MRPKKFDFDPDNTDANGIYEAAAVAGAGALTLDGALVSGTVAAMDYARQISIDSAGNDSGITFTVTGTDGDGKALVEVITGGNAAAVESAGYFKTITSIVASAAAAGNVTIGTVDEFVSQAIPLNHKYPSAATILADVTGTINYTIYETFDDIQASVNAVQSAHWDAITAFSAKTADVKGSATVGATAIRLVVNSFTDTAEIQLYVSQPTL